MQLKYVVVLAGLLAVVALAGAESPATTTGKARRRRRKESRPRTIKRILKNDIKCDFSAFYTLIENYKMDGLIDGDEVTVFAPKSGSIQKELKLIKKLKEQNNEGAIRDFIRGHVVKGEDIDTSDDEGKTKFKSANGGTIRIKAKDEIRADGGRRKVAKTIGASNGVVYCINGAIGNLKEDINRRRGRRSATTTTSRPE